MDEETEVKAPVTRLRRRLSVEQSEDRTSSPALGTPTKKRGGRKAAKPELDLIDENEAENNLKKTTKKNIVKDVVESESEKPVTPSRRSARIKSNTSIVSDTVQNVDSPRAKRASRRTSQVGSDTEMSLTPARTRRTRKDSTSSIEKQAVATKTQISEIITEEPDNAMQSTTDGLKTSDNKKTTETPIRKSPRLVKKKSRNSNSSTQDEEKNDNVESNNELINTTESMKNDAVEPDIETDTNTDTNIIKENHKSNCDTNRLSVSSCNLINNLEDKPKNIKSNTNKSFTETQDINKNKSRRHRTKSWTTLTNVSSINEEFYSDNEIIKKKHQQKLGDNIKRKSFNSGSGDSKDNHLSNDEELNCSQNKISSASNKKKRESVISEKSDIVEVSNLFQKDPSEIIRTTIVMEDSDSNPLQGNMSKKNINEDQCVPVVDHQLENKNNELPEFTLSTSFDKKESIVSKVINTNNTCEPMDVDETLPDCLPNASTKGSENQKSSSLHTTLETSSSMLNKTSNKSKRKSSLSTSQNLEKSNNENKSTLVLSQLKDLSNAENKSPKFSKKDQLSQSVNILNITQENEKHKKFSQNYLTSTPLQQKTDLGVTTKNKSNNNFGDNVSKNEDNITPKKNVSKIAPEPNSETELESDEESKTSKTSNLLENEAEEAGDDYESGDSQDEDEKQYERENEIVEKGETLSSEDEISNDSDYEKDSFVVTSDEEDNELLSGSGDDLSMSDNELKMDPKSKKKYNARKLKEQKQASREMYESRHQLNTSKKDRSLKSSKIEEYSCERLNSSNSDNSEDNIKCTKKKRRMRLDSTATDSINISKIENSNSSKKNIDMSESSYNENNLKQKEITISEEAPDNINETSILHVKVDNTSNKINSKSMESKNPMEDSDNDTNSLSSEDENITQNYNDVLNDLKVKTANHSLNIEKKSKKNSSTPIVDHLNITQTKALKTQSKSSQKENTTTNSNKQNKKSTENWSVTNFVNQCEEGDQNSNENEDTSSILDTKNLKFGDYSLNLENKSKTSKPSIVDQLNLTQGNKKSKKDKREKRKSNVTNTNQSLNNDDSSDSIDLKLLFSEDSINSSDINKESVKKAENDTENFIPLKKVEAKTDIRASNDLVGIGNTDPPFFVDTIGNQASDSSGDEEIVNKINTHEKTQKEEESSEDDSNDEPLEVSYKKEQNEKFVKNNKEENVDETEEESGEDDSNDKIQEVSYKKEQNEKFAKTEKKENIDETDHGTKPLTDKSLLKTPQSEKKRKKSLSKNISDKSLTKDKKINTSASFNVSSLDVLFSVENIMEGNNNKSINKTPNNEKKIKKLSLSNGFDEESNNTEVLHNKSIPKTPKSDKKKKKISESEHSEACEMDDKISDESFNKQNYVSISISKTPSSEKKKMKKLSQSNGSYEASSNTEVTINKSVPKTPGSEKKKMRKLSQSNSSDEKTDYTEDVLNKSIPKTPKSDKKKKKLSESEHSEAFEMNDKISDESFSKQNYVSISISKTPGSEKKMRKLSQSNGSDKEIDNTEVSLNKSINKIPKSDKEKKNLSESEHSEAFEMNDKTSDESFNRQNYVSISMSKTPGSEKKKMRKLSRSNESNEETDSTEFPRNKSINRTPNSEKKKKLSESENAEKFNLVGKILDESINKQNNVSKSNAKTPNSDKKKKKISLSENSETCNLIDDISDESVNKQNCDIKKKHLSQLNHDESGVITNSKKRKRSSSGHLQDSSLLGDLSKTNVTENETLVGKKKKRKISQKSEENDTKDCNPKGNTEITCMTQNIKVTETVNLDMQPAMLQKSAKNKINKESYDTMSKAKNTDTNQIDAKEALSESKHKDDNESVNLKPKSDKNKKRKNREDDNDSNEAIKIRKENSFDHIHISRLPPSILNKLDDQPKKIKISSKKQKVTSTTDFVVEETRKRRNKPSNFLEESIYLNDDESMEEQKKKTIIKKPKVLPFVPTATTSNSGFTTNFKVNVMPQEIKFVAQSNNVNSFKNEYLYGKKIKRLGTYDLYKKNRNIKMSKF